MTNIVPWIVLILVAVFLLWRLVTSRSRATRRMFERMSRKELESLDVDKVRRQGLEKVYREVLSQKQQQGS